MRRLTTALLLAGAGCGADPAPDRALDRGAWEARLLSLRCATRMVADFPMERPARPPAWELYETTHGQFGVVCLSHDQRLAAAGDAAIADAYAALLDREPRRSERVDTTMVLWWLAEGGRARDADQFVRRVAPYDYPNYEDQAFAAWYGVARHAATDPAARAQMAKLPDKIGPFQRGRLTMMLALVNDTAARDALRRLRATEHFPRELAQIADSVLAWPALSPFAGRWPCSADQRPGRTASGAFGCVADTARALVVGSPAPPREVARLQVGQDTSITLTADGASPLADGEAAVTIAIERGHEPAALVHLPLSVATPLLGTLQSLAEMNRFPWALLPSLDDPAAQVLVSGASDAAANRIFLRKLTPFARPWEVAIVNDRGIGPEDARVRLTRTQLGALARALRRATDAARADAARGAWRKQ